MPGKFDEVHHILQRNPLHVIAFTESRLDDHIPDNVVPIENYSLYRNDRSSSGGGVAMYINNIGIQHNLREDLMPDSLELIAVEVKHSNAKPIIVLAWYRAPDSSTKKLDDFESELHQLELENKDYVVIADFNCDLLSTVYNCYTKKLNDICNSYNLTQFILKIHQPYLITCMFRTVIMYNLKWCDSYRFE